jgi:hypothetical protein
MESRLGWANELDTELDACARAWAYSKVGVGRQGSPGPSTVDGMEELELGLGRGAKEGQAPGHQGRDRQPSAQGHNCGFSKSFGSFFSGAGITTQQSSPAVWAWHTHGCGLRCASRACACAEAWWGQRRRPDTVRHALPNVH